MQADQQLEAEVIQTLWEESQSLGPARGRALLGRCGLIPGDFTDATNQRLFRRLCEALAADRVPLLERGDEAGAERLATAELLNPARLDALSDRLKAQSVRRELHRAAREVYQLSQEQELSTAELIAKAKASVGGIAQREGNWTDLGPALARTEQHLRDVADGKRQPCIPSGFRQIDEVTGGFPATLVVVVAMPGVGKSAWVGSVIKHLAETGTRAAVFSMEDASDWMAFRFLAHESGVPQGALRRRPLDPSQWQAVGRVSSRLAAAGKNILVDDREALTPAQVLSAAREAIARGAKIIFLDNMTAMRLPRGDRRDLEFQDFLCSCRALANETGVPFVVISHARRREGLDVDQLPLLTDCAESSAFEKLCRLAYGLARKKDSNELTVGVLKNTNGKAWQKFTLLLRPESALAEEPRRQGAAPWDWSTETRDGDGRL